MLPALLGRVLLLLRLLRIIVILSARLRLRRLMIKTPPIAHTKGVAVAIAAAIDTADDIAIDIVTAQMHD